MTGTDDGGFWQEPAEVQRICQNCRVVDVVEAIEVLMTHGYEVVVVPQDEPEGV